ncbi:hypothetical protein OsI_35330 [Oryza sativa Indica Group]|uniref:Uncharacterized protein n=1 Tax=Oryza sativa subsp. indica TaxID=39946 RepID=B8BJE9_ORYSI|nr:hypothetical protein OsI_35330 [Oryza sativa Indica Group]
MVAWHSHFADATQVTEAFAAWCAAAAGKANGRRCGRGVDGDVAREMHVCCCSLSPALLVAQAPSLATYHEVDAPRMSCGGGRRWYHEVMWQRRAAGRPWLRPSIGRAQAKAAWRSCVYSSPASAHGSAAMMASNVVAVITSSM